MFPQNAKFSGVTIVAESVEKAVKLTESATLALEREEMKLEILPPGHAAIKIIPMAMEGGGLIMITNIKVKAGSRKICEKIPSKADLGYRNIFLKCSVLIPSATPNMMTARVIFMYKSPPSLKFKRV